jgi:Kef-type K+ transport system membrane component KefB
VTPPIAVLGIGPSGTPPAPPGAADEALVGILAGLFVLLLAAKLGEEVMRRLRQPAVVGELLGGFVVGPYALGLVTPGETAQVLAELGVVILLFAVGLEVRTDDLLAVGRSAVQTAVAGVVLPIAAGFGLAILLGAPALAATYVALALAATSIGITSRVLADAKVMDRPFSRIILGAALIDDVLALILIGIVSGASEGDIVTSTLVLATTALGVVGLGFAIARRARGLRREVFTWPLFAETPLVPAFILMLGIGLLAVWVGLAAIIGAFVAGLIVAETEARDELEHEIAPLRSIFTPFFFAVTGAQLDLSMLLDPPTLVAALSFAAAGIATKFVGGFLGARSAGRWSAATVGGGMVPRGEVGIVVANLALAAGAIESGLFAAVIVAVVITTIVAPYLLAVTIPRAIREAPT